MTNGRNDRDYPSRDQGDDQQRLTGRWIQDDETGYLRRRFDDEGQSDDAYHGDRGMRDFDDRRNWGIPTATMATPTAAPREAAAMPLISPVGIQADPILATEAMIAPLRSRTVSSAQTTVGDQAATTAAMRIGRAGNSPAGRLENGRRGPTGSAAMFPPRDDPKRDEAPDKTARSAARDPKVTFARTSGSRKTSAIS